MKIKIDIDGTLEEDEIIIKCRRLEKNIQKIHEYVQDVLSAEAPIVFYDDEKEYYLNLEDILFFETEQNVVYAHTAEAVYKVKQRLYELEEILPGKFIRVSKSTILNVNMILSVTKNITSSSLVTFYKSHKQVYVSRLYFNDLRKRLSERRN